MARDLVFNVLNRPTLETLGETEVISRVYTDKSKTDYVDTAVGVVVKERGAKTTSAFLYDDGPAVRIQVGDSFKTRSQAGHAVRAAHDEVAKTEAAPAVVADTTVTDGSVDGVAADIGAAADEIAAEDAAAELAAEEEKTAVDG